MTVKTKSELNAQFPDNTTRQITPSRLRDLVDTTFDLVENLAEETVRETYWRTYHVDQSTAADDDSGDGSKEAPFYTVYAALEKMNAEKLELGILPGEISSLLTRILIYGVPNASKTSSSHYESLLITRQEYVQWQIHARIKNELSLRIFGYFKYMFYWRGSATYCNVEDYNGWVLPPLTITNMKHQDFVDNFLKYNWDTRIVDPSDARWNGKKRLSPYVSYTDLYGENPFQSLSEVDKSGTGRFGELGDWNGGPLIGETFVDVPDPSQPVTYFQQCELRNINFNGASNFLKVGCLIISGRNSASEITTIHLTSFHAENCSGFYFKNVLDTGHFIPSELDAVTIFENAQEMGTTIISSTPFTTSRYKLKRRDTTYVGGGSTYAQLTLLPGRYRELTLEGDITNGTGGYSADKITLPSIITADRYFAITGNVFAGRAISGLYTSTTPTSVFAGIVYLATSSAVNFSQVTSRILCKANTGVTTIVEAVIGEYVARATLPNVYGGSGLLVVAGTLDIGHLTCTGAALIRAGATVNVSGMIKGNLTVAAGATLNAVSLTVKGNVILEAGATVTWKGGTFTGTLTDPDESLGGATAGSYINV